MSVASLSDVLDPSVELSMLLGRRLLNAWLWLNRGPCTLASVGGLTVVGCHSTVHVELTHVEDAVSSFILVGSGSTCRHRSLSLPLVTQEH